MRAVSLIFPFFLLGAASQTAPPVTLPVHSPAVDASSENSRLRQMESIYQQQLRSRHIPLLGAYVTNLQRLAAAAADPAPFQKEIERIQAIVSGGGVIDLAAAVQGLRTPAEMPMPNPMPPPRRAEKAMISLNPALSRRISPLPTGSASPRAAAIGEIEWRLETLPPGAYEVVLQYSLPAASESISGEVIFGDHKIPFELDASKGTPKGSFRLLRLGQFTLDQETRGETLLLRAGTSESRTLLVREVVITPVKNAP